MIITLLGAAAAAAVAAVARRRARESECEEAEKIVARLVRNAEFGHPVGGTQTQAAPRKRLGDGPPCHGTLVLHDGDGRHTCEGGHGDCWPDIPTIAARYSHRAITSCRGRNHGCGRCQTRGDAGYTPAPPLDHSSHY